MTQVVSAYVKQLKQGCNEDFRYIEVINKPIQKAKNVCNLCFKLATNKVFLLLCIMRYMLVAQCNDYIIMTAVVFWHFD